MNHTEGPLRVAKPNPYGGIVETEDGQAVAQTFAIDRDSPETIDDNAQHIVALWNACEGIDPEAIEPALQALLWLHSWFTDEPADGSPPPSWMLSAVSDAIALAESQS